MRRRSLIAALAGVALPVHRPALAQQAAMPTIGYLSVTSPETNPAYLPSFHEGLKENGYVEGRNVAIVFRYAEGRYERLPALAAELVALDVAVIAALPVPATRAAMAATRTIPIVFLSGTDPVAQGLVASQGRPGGNATGIHFYSAELAPKRVELLREMLPKARSVALLLNPTNPSAYLGTQRQEVAAAARSLQLELDVLEARTTGEIENAFQTMAARRVDMLVVATDPFFIAEREHIVALAARHAIPAAYDVPEFVRAGGLASYGPNVADAIRMAGVYVGRILKGAKPADLPVQQPSKVDLTINLRTARALGIVIPQSVLLRADEVIE